jgi:hypothetical protein
MTLCPGLRRRDQSFLRVHVGGAGERADARDHLRGVRACGGAVTDAAGDALQNASETESVVGKIPIERGYAVAAGLRAIEIDSFVECWDADGF